MRRSHSSGSSLASTAAATERTPLKVEAKTTSNLSRLRSSLTSSGARQPIELVDRPVREIAFERAHQVEILARRDRHVRLPKVGEEGQEHGTYLARGALRRAMLAPGTGRGRHGGRRRSTDLCLAARRRAGHGSLRHRRHSRPARPAARAASTRRRASRGGGSGASSSFSATSSTAAPTASGRSTSRSAAGALIGADDADRAHGQPRDDDAARARSPTPWDDALDALETWLRNGGGAVVRQFADVSRSSRSAPKSS